MDFIPSDVKFIIFSYITNYEDIKTLFHVNRQFQKLTRNYITLILTPCQYRLQVRDILKFPNLRRCAIPISLYHREDMRSITFANPIIDVSDDVFDIRRFKLKTLPRQNFATNGRLFDYVYFEKSCHRLIDLLIEYGQNCTLIAKSEN